MDRLRSLGLSAALLSQIPYQDLDARAVGRIVFESHAHCVVATEDGDLPCQIHPRLQDRTERLVVGDWVRLDRTGDPVWIVGRFERHGVLARRDPDRGVQVLCANVDLALVATALDRDLNARRLERYLAVVAHAGLASVLVLTKADQVPPEEHEDAVRALGVGFDVVVPVSARTGFGLDALRDRVPHGVTAALLGSSGVGKTTLINALAGTAFDTGEVRERDLRGRHTTTSRRLVPLASGGWLVDNPGLRQVGPLDADGVDRTFADVSALTAQCRFRDCSHDSEPGCAVQDALASGALPEARFDAWVKLQREVAYETRRIDRDAARAERARWKRIARDQRERYARRERDG